MNSPAKVFLHRVNTQTCAEGWGDSASKALDACGGLHFIKRHDLVAIKLHVGEPGLKTFLPPPVARAAATLVKARGGRPFLTDTAVLYASARATGVGHTETAIRHGFTLEGVGAPFLPADGLSGNWERDITIPGRHYKSVGIAASIADADGMVVISHATGHLAAGFGATLKNLGMGCASRKGKLLQHSDTKPYVKKSRCIKCEACVESCPENAIATDPQNTATVVIDQQRCIGCGECIAVCRNDAVGFQWDTSCGQLQEKMVEHALGAMKAQDGKVVYLLGLVNLTKDCDCLAPGSPIIAKDIGFAASTDPVALDQAGMDLVKQQEGKSLDQMAYPELDGTVQLSYAEALGLGSRRYELVQVP